MNAFYCEVVKMSFKNGTNVLIVIDFMLPGYAVSTTPVYLMRPLTLFCFDMVQVGSTVSPKFAAYSIAGGIRHGHV